MRKIVAGAVLLLALGLQAGAQAGQTAPNTGGGKAPDGNCGMLYGKDHALTFCAPDGWLLDNSIMNDQGIYAVFYLAGSTFQNAKESGTFMYFNVVGKPAGATVEKLMSADADDVKKNAPASIVLQGDPIVIGDRSVPILRFAPGGFNRFEAVAYIGEEKVLVMVAMSSIDEQHFKSDFPAFVRLVQSYKFLGSDVTIEHK